ncbi:MAG: hypothetical protein ACPGWR_04800 [Ardenticatenaceae bacterium]
MTKKDAYTEKAEDCEVSPELIKAKDNSSEAIKATKAELQRELDWYQQVQAEAGQKLHQLKGHDVSEQRGEWGRYKQKLDIHQRALESFQYSLEALEKRLQDALEVAQDIELGELLLEELEQIRNEALEVRLVISEIKRPQTPPEREKEHDSAQTIPTLEELQDVTARNAIIARGGGGSQVQKLGSHKGLSYADLTVSQLQTLVEQGDAVQQNKARTALKIIKQAAAKRQKYGGKS